MVKCTVAPDIFCDECGDLVEADQYNDTLYIRPCETCINKAKEESYHEGYHEGEQEGKY